jgi:L-rhamnose mutarotase
MQEHFQIKPDRIASHILLPFVIFVAILPFYVSCTQKSAKRDSERVFVMTTDLVDDSSLIHIYDSLHSRAGVWPELKKANMASGIREIKIYRFNTRLTMMIHLSEDADLSKMDSLYLNADEKIMVWGKLMSGFQRALPGRDTSEKWVEMKLIHHYQDGEYLK